MSNRTQKLKYLGVEMLKKDATKNSTPEVGLFRGLRERSDNTGETAQSIRMILIGSKDKENDVKALNLDIFNVLSIKMLYGDTKELVVFKNTDADQEQAMELLQAALKEFQEAKRMVDNDPEIVDTKTFEDVPQEFFTPQKEEKKSSTHQSGNNYGYGGYGNCGFQNDDWKKKQAEREKQKKKEEKMRWTPTLIKRKGDLPGLKVLNAIKKKVAAISTGDYEIDLVDPDPKDTFEDGKKSTTTA